MISCAISSSRRILLSLFDGKTDILFLCSSVYWAGVDGSVKRFIADNKDKTGLLVNVSTAAMKESTYAHIKKIAEKTASEYRVKSSIAEGNLPHCISATPMMLI